MKQTENRPETRPAAGRLRRWELALTLAMCFTLFHGLAFGGASGLNWWGVIFPELCGGAVQVETGGFPDGREIQVKLRFVEWLETLLERPVSASAGDAVPEMSAPAPSARGAAPQKEPDNRALRQQKQREPQREGELPGLVPEQQHPEDAPQTAA